jgi:hypothetical protein
VQVKKDERFFVFQDKGVNNGPTGYGLFISGRVGPLKKGDEFFFLTPRLDVKIRKPRKKPSVATAHMLERYGFPVQGNQFLWPVTGGLHKVSHIFFVNHSPKPTAKMDVDFVVTGE